MGNEFEPPPVLDFRPDGLSLASTTVLVHADYRGHAWIHAGEIELTERAWSQGSRGCWTLEVRRHDATDFEHDAAVALRIGLAGVSFRMASGGRLWLDGVVAGDDPGMFRVPEPDWNQLEGAFECRRVQCRAKAQQHLVVEEGRYIPPPNAKLFDRLRGLRIEIITGISR
jgi:hypothetical protein